eukprot:m.148342 g.148342  ORF g.148342 m.148342 type:complete len:1591 (-) comp14176_c0_seq1:195-4967(-)
MRSGTMLATFARRQVSRQRLGFAIVCVFVLLLWFLSAPSSKSCSVGLSANVLLSTSAELEALSWDNDAVSYSQPSKGLAVTPAFSRSAEISAQLSDLRRGVRLAVNTSVLQGRCDALDTATSLEESKRSFRVWKQAFLARLESLEASLDTANDVANDVVTMTISPTKGVLSHHLDSTSASVYWWWYLQQLALKSARRLHGEPLTAKMIGGFPLADEFVFLRQNMLLLPASSTWQCSYRCRMSYKLGLRTHPKSMKPYFERWARAELLNHKVTLPLALHDDLAFKEPALIFASSPFDMALDIDSVRNGLESLVVPRGFVAFHQAYYTGQNPQRCMQISATEATNPLHAMNMLLYSDITSVLDVFHIHWIRDVRIFSDAEFTCEKREVFALLYRPRLADTTQPTHNYVPRSFRFDLSIQTLKAVQHAVASPKSIPTWLRRLLVTRPVDIDRRQRTAKTAHLLGMTRTIQPHHAANGILTTSMSQIQAAAAMHALFKQPDPECDPSKDICNVFFLWMSDRDTWSFLNRLAVESALTTFSKARVTIMSNTLPVDFFNDLYESQRVYVWPFHAASLLEGIPGARWLQDALDSHSRHLPTHLSDFLRYVLLYRYGGLFSDTDAVWYNDVPLTDAIGKNFLGKIDSVPIMKSCDWCVDERWYLANGIMRFQQQHDLLAQVLDRINDMPYDPENRLAIGPHLVTKVFNDNKFPDVVLLDEEVLFDLPGPSIPFFVEPPVRVDKMTSLLTSSAAMHLFESTFKHIPHYQASTVQQLVSLLPWVQHDPVCKCIWSPTSPICLPYASTVRYFPGYPQNQMVRLCIKLAGIHTIPANMEASMSPAVTKWRQHDTFLVVAATKGRVQSLYQPRATNITIPIPRHASHQQLMELAQFWYVQSPGTCNDLVNITLHAVGGKELAVARATILLPCSSIGNPDIAGQERTPLPKDYYSDSQAHNMLTCTQFGPHSTKALDQLVFFEEKHMHTLQSFVSRHPTKQQIQSNLLSTGPGKKQYKVALVVVATGKYYSFLDDFVASAEQYFLPNHEIHYFVLTDNKPFQNGPTDRVHRLQQPVFGWPLDSMFRYQTVLRQYHELRDMDYLYAIDADVVFAREVGEEILGETVGVTQAFTFGQPQHKLVFETYNRSVAAVDINGADHAMATCYYAGGFFGGSLTGFHDILRATAWLMEWDMLQGRNAVFDDESYINRIFTWQRPSVVLPANYIYPEPPCDLIWGLRHIQFDHTYPPTVLNIGCRKHLSIDVGGSPRDAADSLSPSSFLLTDHARTLNLVQKLGNGTHVSTALENKSTQDQQQAAQSLVQGHDMVGGDTNSAVPCVHDLTVVTCITAVDQITALRDIGSSTRFLIHHGLSPNCAVYGSTVKVPPVIAHSPHSLARGVVSAVHVQSCSLSTMQSLLSRVKTKYVVVLDAQLHLGWQLSIHKWITMFQRDELWSHADSASVSGHPQLRIAGVCPKPTKSVWKLGSAAVSKLACDWAVSDAALRSPLEGSSSVNPNKVTLSSDFRTSSCENTAEATGFQGCLAETTALTSALTQATTQNPTFSSNEVVSVQDMLSLVAQASGISYQAAKCFADKQALVYTMPTNSP